MNLQVRLPVGTTPTVCGACNAEFRVYVSAEAMASLPVRYRRCAIHAPRKPTVPSVTKKAYNAFMRLEMPKVRLERPDLAGQQGQAQRWSIAASRWATSPMNPKNEGAEAAAGHAGAGVAEPAAGDDGAEEVQP